LKYYLIVLLLCCPLVVRAALIDTYYPDSQPELDYLFESGQIDLEQYKLLDEYFSSLPFMSGNEIARLNDLLSIWVDYLDTTLTSQQYQELQDEISPKHASIKIPEEFKSSISYRIYQDLSEDKSHRQLMSFRGEFKNHFIYYIEMEKNVKSGDFYFLRRNLTLRLGQTELELGNYLPDWGMGVTLGYHSEFLAKSDDHRFKSIMFPAKGRFNGIRFQYNGKFKPHLLFSYDRSKKYRGQLIAVGSDYQSDKFTIGLMNSYYQLDNYSKEKRYEDLIVGSHFRWTSGKYKLQAEISESDLKYIAWNFQINRKYDSGKFSLFAWNYNSGYLNPFGAGRANSDYRTTYDEDSIFSYRSRQNGEWGIFTQSGWKIMSGHNLGISANYWRDGGAEEKVRSRFSDRFVLSGSLDAMITYLWGDDNLDKDYGDRQHLRLDLIYSDRPWTRLRFTTEVKRIYYTSGRKEYLRAELKATFPISAAIKSSLKISRIDSDLGDGAPGYWFIYFSEEIVFTNGLIARIIFDTREGEKYDLLRSARFNVTLTLLTG
jgi:hypothetical protein